MLQTVLLSTEFSAVAGYMIDCRLDVLYNAVSVSCYIVASNSRSSDLYILCYGVSTIRGPRVKFLRECVDINM